MFLVETKQKNNKNDNKNINSNKNKKKTRKITAELSVASSERMNKKKKQQQQSCIWAHVMDSVKPPSTNRCRCISSDSTRMSNAKHAHTIFNITNDRYSQPATEFRWIWKKKWIKTHGKFNSHRRFWTRNARLVSVRYSRSHTCTTKPLRLNFDYVQLIARRESVVAEPRIYRPHSRDNKLLLNWESVE